MKNLLTIGIVALTLANTADAQDSSARYLASRTELHSIQSLTLSDTQFLAGDNAAGKSVIVSGLLRIAQGEGRLPLVVLIHGASGMGANIDMWSRDLNEMGISTLALDGFTGRGLTNVNPDQASLGRLNMILDAYRMLDILSKHPRVDPSRVVLMGFSRGGQTALYASLKRFNKTWNKSGIDFAAYISFYPDCMTTYRTDTEVMKRPIRIFCGARDDYDPVAPCKAYVERLRAAGHDVALTEYPNASHAFDNPLLASTPTVVKNAQTVRNCRISEDETGQLINTATGQPFTYQDECVERDPHVAYDAATTEAARQSVRSFLKEMLKLPKKASPNHTLQRTRPSRLGCNRTPSWAGSLSFIR
jgi:dienelactone hydrolase